ncbi:Alpha/beta-hydrolase [Mycena sanguinolenta]|uniref:Alpha/beta-hydrolase n=1 Tax=Mycena sanguinolenta TaxID=230812 RepID=A0A8H6X2L9_9AGAR|nr:Alpha/beta-hydrolase [Mycena sanguinolenta]
MRLTFAVLLAVNAVLAFPSINSATVDKRAAVSTATYNDLVFYFQYASSAYVTTGCAMPNGNPLVSNINNAATDTQGFVVRDDTRKEIVVALRGSTSLQDFLTDAEIVLVPFVSPGVKAPAGSTAHAGFLAAWNSVASTVISTVRTQLAAHPGYQLVSTGHSLGGALSSLAGISLEQNFPGNTVRMYTYGQPRTYNPTGANFINAQFGSRAFRSVHTIDGVPTIIPRIDGYQHHGVEFWNFLDPSSAVTTKSCASSGEDPTCSDSIPSEGIDAAHLEYFNIPASTPFCT